MNNIRACINLPGTCSDQPQKQVFLHREVYHAAGKEWYVEVADRNS